MNTETDEGVKLRIVSEGENYPLISVQPDYTVSFYLKDVLVGKLDWNDGVMKFTGDADASAKLFFDNIIKRYEYNK